MIIGFRIAQNLLLALVIGLTSGSSLWGLEFSEIYQSTRGRTLGQAMTAKVADATSLFYNPAGIGQGAPHMQILDTQGSYSSALPTFVTNVQTAIKAADTNSVTSLAQSYLNQNIHADLSLIPFLFQRGNFASGLLISNSNDFYVGPQLIPSLKLRSTSQVGATIGYSFGQAMGPLRFGVAGKILMRAGLDLPIDSSQIISSLVGGGSISSMFNANSIIKNNAEAGLLYDIDLGVQGTLPLSVFALKYGASLQNLLNRDGLPVGSYSGTAMPTIMSSSYFALERTLNLGLAMSIRPSALVESEFSADFRNILRTSLDKTWGPRLGFGWETRVMLTQIVQIGLRLGLMNASYFSYSVMARLLGFTFEFGQYSVELGGTTRQYEDLRTAARVAFEW